MSQQLKRNLERILARESGAFVKDPGGKISIALLYPNRYGAGMSSLGFQGIYGLLNEMPDVVCERAFLPDSVDMGEYRRSGMRLLTLETQRPVSDFHVVAFSVAYENDYPNVLRLMELAGIPFRPDQRNAAAPLVILGGVCTAYNPEPLADFMDVVFLGEAEKSLQEFIDVLRSGSTDRKDLLRRMASVHGVYVPSLYVDTFSPTGRFAGKRRFGAAPEKISRGDPADLDTVTLKTVIRSPDAEFSEMAMVEVMRGCPWSCRFCVASKAYRPVRYRSPDVLRRMIRESRNRFEKVGLVGPSLSDYAPLPEIMNEDVVFSVSSLRAMKKTESLVRKLAEQGQRSLSIAPEAATERLRRVVRKKLSEADILGIAKLVLEAGVSQLRLYFMIGLPTERPEDVEAIPSLATRIVEQSARGHVTLSVSPFVPKPFTPFQWMPMNRPAELKRKLKVIRAGLRNSGRVALSHDSVNAAVFEGFLARADRRASLVLEEMVLSNRSDWLRICAGEGLPVEDLLYESWDPGLPLPWDFIEAGIRKEDLSEDSLQAFREA